jgi:PAS domain S-box-containing protein
MLEKIKKQGMVGDFEGEGRKKDGGSFWASVNAQFYCDDHGQIQGLETFVRDISERKNSEKALKQSEERFRALIYNSTDIILYGP